MGAAHPLLQHRRAAGLSLRALADRCAVDYRRLHLAEKYGLQLHPHELIAVARVLKVRAAVLRKGGDDAAA